MLVRSLPFGRNLTGIIELDPTGRMLAVHSGNSLKIYKIKDILQSVQKQFERGVDNQPLYPQIAPIDYLNLKLQLLHDLQKVVFSRTASEILLVYYEGTVELYNIHTQKIVYKWKNQSPVLCYSICYDGIHLGLYNYKSVKLLLKESQNKHLEGSKFNLLVDEPGLQLHEDHTGLLYLNGSLISSLCSSEKADNSLQQYIKLETIQSGYSYKPLKYSSSFCSNYVIGTIDQHIVGMAERSYIIHSAFSNWKALAIINQKPVINPFYSNKYYESFMRSSEERLLYAIYTQTSISVKLMTINKKMGKRVILPDYQDDKIFQSCQMTPGNYQQRFSNKILDKQQKEDNIQSSYNPAKKLQLHPSHVVELYRLSECKSRVQNIVWVGLYQLVFSMKSKAYLLQVNVPSIEL